MKQNNNYQKQKQEKSQENQKELQNSDDEDGKKLQIQSAHIQKNDLQNQLVPGCIKAYKESPNQLAYIKDLLKGRHPPKKIQLQYRISKHKIVLMNDFQIPLMFQISKIYESRNKKIMQFEVRFSYFIIIIKVLNICPKDNLSFQLKNWINSGVYGAVYEVEINNIKYAVKKMALNKHSVYEDITNAIEQYSIMKLCSALEIGPAFRSAFGFDLIITQDSILFSCEMGLSIYEYVRSVSNNHSEFEANFQKLEESLILMHSLGIIHNDIKPNNIIYSQQYNRFCFIDFGLSEVNQNPIGSLKKVKPRGSIYYCSQEMKKLFFNDFSEGQVDLYYNDMVALQKSKQNMISIIKSYKKQYFIQQRQIHCRNDYQMINDESNKPIDNKYMSKKDHKNDNINDAFEHQKYFLNHNEISKSLIQSEIQYIILLRIIYIVQQKKMKWLQKLAEVESLNLRKILSINLKKISFIFFECGKCPSLVTIYKKILGYIFQCNTLSAQTKEVLDFKLQPYFINKIDKQGEQNNINLKRYLLEQEKSKEMIRKRYEDEVPFLQNEEIVQRLNKNKCPNFQSQNQIIVFLTADISNDIQPALVQLQQVIDLAGSKFLMETINFHISKIDYQRVWAQVTQAELTHFETIFKKLGLKIRFQVKSNVLQEKQINSSEKYLFYLYLFLEFYLSKIKQYRFNSILGSFIIHQIPAHSNFNINLFKDLYYTGNQETQIEKRNSKKQLQNDELIDYFRQSPNDQFQVFQMCLNIVDKVIKTLHGFLSYQVNLHINQRFANLMQIKIRQCLIIYLIMLKYIYLKKQKQQIFISAICLEKILIVKCIQFRQRALYEKLTSAQDFNDFFTVIQSYQNIHNIWERLGFDQQPLKLYMQAFKIKNQCDKLMKQTLEKSQSWYRIQKQLFEVIIFTTFIPFQEYQKYNILKRYYDIIKQENSNKEIPVISSYAQYNAISKTFKLALQFDDFNTIINIFEYIYTRKSVIINPRLNYSIYYFFKKSNNNKKIKQCLINMNRLNNILGNQDVQHFNFEQRVEQISVSIKNDQRVSKKIASSYDDYQPSNFSINKQAQPHAITNINMYPQTSSQQKLSLSFIKEWNSTKQRLREDKQLQTRLFDLRFILRQVFYSQENLTELFKYLSRQYQLQIQKYEHFLLKKIEFLKQRKQIKTQLWKFFGQQCLNQQQYWQKVKLSFIIRVRSKLLSELMINLQMLSVFHIELIKEQWENFEDAIKGLITKQKQVQIRIITSMISKYPSLLTYLEYKTIVSRILFLHGRSIKKYIDNDNLLQQQQIQIINNNKTTYIHSFTQYLAAATTRYQKIYKTINLPINNQFLHLHNSNKIMKNTQIIKTFRCEQPFSNMVIDCYQGVVDEKDVDREIKKCLQLNRQFSQGFVMENELKKCFYDIVQSQGIHMIFSLYQFRVRIIQTMISLGSKLILSGKTQEQIGCYFLTFMFYHICQFVKKFKCSSYSYLVVGMVNSFQQKMSNQVLKTTKDNKNDGQLFLNRDIDKVCQDQNENLLQLKKQLIQKLRFITAFQKDLIKILIEQTKQQKIQHVAVVLLACERVKLQILLFLFKNKLVFQNDLEVSPLKSDLEIIKKVQLVICGNGMRLEYLAKIFFKHTLYCYLVMINLTNKKFNLSKEKISGWLAFSNRKNNINKNKTNEDNFSRYIEIKHFRSTRRILSSSQEKKQARKITFSIQQQYYYLIFEPIKQQSFRKIPYNRKEKFSFVNKTQQSSIILNKARRCFGQKINRYLLISCFDSVQK